MRRAMTAVALALGLGVGLQLARDLSLAQPETRCSDDSVLSGTVCIDKYEASAWYVPPEQKGLVTRIQNGTVTLASLRAGGAVQVGLVKGDLAASGCPLDGAGCVSVYAASLPGVQPAGFNTYFQAAAAARNSLKRLPTNQEWQAAALGTPDGAPCNVGPDEAYPPPANTGSAPDCVSDVGAVDMVGNLWERVADWADFANACTKAVFGKDLECFGGPGSPEALASHPSAIIRGGFSGPFTLGGGTNAGVFALRANVTTEFNPAGIGFRCVR